MADEKKTVELPRVSDEKITVEMATLPVILGEVRQLRREHGHTDRSIKDLAFQVQQNHEVHGGKIRSLESRAEAGETRVTTLERRADTLEKDAKDLKTQVANLRGETVADFEEKIKRQTSLTEEQIQQRLAEEAQERSMLDEQVNARIAPVETEIKMLSTMLVQSLGLHPPPRPNPDGSIPPADEEKKRPKNAIQKQTFWTRAAAISGGFVVLMGALDKMGAFDELGKLLSKLWSH